MAEFGTSESAMAMTRKVLQLHDNQKSRPTFAIPDGGEESRRGSIRPHLTIKDLVGVELPSEALMDNILDVYFYTVHWFSLVVHEAPFRQRYERIKSANAVSPSDRPCLLLLLMILIRGCRYGRGTEHEQFQDFDLESLGAQYLDVVRRQFMDIAEGDGLEFVQICILLGSYWLYWGRPKSSFALLGTAIKAGQALLLHRKVSSKRLSKLSHGIEERKRVWWTIYTWDR